MICKAGDNGITQMKNTVKALKHPSAQNGHKFDKLEQ